MKQEILPMEVQHDNLTYLKKRGEYAANLEQEANDLEAKVKELRAQSREIREKELPDLMNEIGIEELTLADGTKIRNEDFIYGKWPKDEEDRMEASAFLEKLGATHMIKHKFTIDKGADDIIKEIRKTLFNSGIPFKDDETVHPASLNKLLREIREERTAEIPSNLFNVHEGQRVVFKNN